MLRGEEGISGDRDVDGFFAEQGGLGRVVKQSTAIAILLAMFSVRSPKELLGTSKNLPSMACCWQSFPHDKPMIKPSLFADQEREAKLDKLGDVFVCWRNTSISRLLRGRSTASHRARGG